MASSDAESERSSGAAADAAGFGAFADSYGGYSDSEREGSEPDSPDLSRRLISVVTGLLRVHVEIAQREAARDQRRIVRGVVYLLVAGFMGLLSLLLLEGLALSGLLALHLRWSWALLTLLGSNLFVVIVLLLSARRALRPPVLPETRALLRRTLGSLLPK